MIKIIIDQKLENYKKQIKEILDISFEYLGIGYDIISGLVDLKHDDVLICYSKLKPEMREIGELISFSATSNIFFFTIDMELYERLSADRYKSLKKELKPFYILGESAPEIKKPKGKFGNYFFYNFDLWGNLFQFANFQKKSDKPVCNMLLNHFFQKLKECVTDDEYFLIRTKMWPKNQNFALCTVAEIDKLYKWQSYSSALKKIVLNFFRHPVAAFKEYIELNFKSEEPYWKFPLLQPFSDLTYCLPAERNFFDVLDTDVSKNLDKIKDRLFELKSNHLPICKSFLYPPYYAEPCVCIKSDEFRKGEYNYMKESEAQFLVSSYLDSASKSNGVACISFKFSDLYDIPYSFNILKNLDKFGQKDEIYYTDLKKIKNWLNLRKKLKWVVDQNNVKIMSNHDIEHLVLEIVGNYEVEYHTGCNLQAKNNLLYISEIKKYNPVNITLKKFNRLNKRID